MNRLLPTALVFMFLFVSACASTESAVSTIDESSEEEASPISGYDLFQNQNKLLVMTTRRTGREIVAGRGGRKTFVSISPGDTLVAIAVANVDESSFYVFDRDARTATKIHSGHPGLVYTGDWSDDGSSFYFGFYQPVGKKMGEGDVRVYDLGGRVVKTVGCSASRAVLSAMSDGSLLVRNSDNIYQVAVDGCATLRTLDARKMHHVTVSPNGQHLAYILRDLVFNRDSGQYEADSTLYLEQTKGSDPLKIVGDKYQPRNVEWSPDSKELAFDVELQDGTGRRTISIYSLESKQSSYLVAPAENSPSRTRPVFSPNGEYVLFVGTMPSGRIDLMYRTTGDQFTHVVPFAVDDSGGMFTSWIDGDTLLITETNGRSHVLGVGEGAEFTSRMGRGWVHALRSIN